MPNRGEDAPFHLRFGSTSSAFKIMHSVPRPQKAGSFCVMNWALNGK